MRVFALLLLASSLVFSLFARRGRGRDLQPEAHRARMLERAVSADAGLLRRGAVRRTVTIRVQHGGDTEEVSDGAIILVDDVDRVRAQIATTPGGAEFRVALQPTLVAPGFPSLPIPIPPWCTSPCTCTAPATRRTRRSTPSTAR